MTAGFTDTRQLARKPSTRTLKMYDRVVEQAYYRLARGVEINIMDIGKVFDAGRAVLAGGGTQEQLDAAIAGVVAQLRRN